MGHLKDAVHREQETGGYAEDVVKHLKNITQDEKPLHEKCKMWISLRATLRCIE